jgi:tetratricopeptide (TPR) repeat protein
MTDASPSSAQSLARLQGYLATDPGNLTLRAELFAAALGSGNFALAQQQTTWVLSRTPTDFVWRHRLATLDMAQLEWEEAGFILQSLLDEGQTDPVISYNLAYVDFARGRVAEAAVRLRPMLRQPVAALPGVLPLLMRCLHRSGEVDEALALFDLHAGANPSEQACGVASLLAIDGGRIAQAKALAENALAREPAQHEARVARATVALGERDADRALADLSVAVRGHPTDGRILSAIGMAQLLKLRLEEARAAFLQAVQYMPGHIGTWHGLAWCELLRKNLPAARNAFESALALDESFGESHGGMAVVQALGGEPVAAAQSIRRANGLDPSGLSARFAQAVLDGEVQQPERFMRMARRALGQRRTADGKSLADVVLTRGR